MILETKHKILWLSNSIIKQIEYQAVLRTKPVTHTSYSSGIALQTRVRVPPARARMVAYFSKEDHFNCSPNSYEVTVYAFVF